MEEAAGSSFSLVVAKGEGMLLVPMTEDLDAIEATLDYADPGAMSAKGTDLGRGIQVGLDSFSGIAGPGHILVLLSDGGDQGGTVRNVAMTARNRSVRIIAIGFGGSEPVIVPGPDDRPLEEPGKGPVRVALDPVPLKTAAAVSSGRYLEAGDAGILSTLGMELAHESKGGMRTVLRVKDQAPLFALIALAALVARLLAQGLATANFGKDGKAYKRNIATEAQRHRGKKGIGIKSEEYSGHSR
jgi:Ca-activated chloride channel family protein